MQPIRIRTAIGTELSFADREAFARAAVSGQVAGDCEVFHRRANRWLPVSAHPAWPSVSALKSESARAAQGRNSDLVLIYPDFIPSTNPVATSTSEADPFDAGPVLAAEEIHRVLYAPRISGPAPRISGPQDRPMLEKALPTFSRALQAAAELVQTKIS